MPEEAYMLTSTTASDASIRRRRLPSRQDLMPLSCRSLAFYLLLLRMILMVSGQFDIYAVVVAHVVDGDFFDVDTGGITESGCAGTVFNVFELLAGFDRGYGSCFLKQSGHLRTSLNWMLMF
jgi:hypothetical protein